MTFTDINNLRTYINSVITTNHSDSITGVQLNTALNGILQFLTPVDLQQYTLTLPASSGLTTGSFNIPLTYTPTTCIVQASIDIVGVIGSATGLAILSSVPVTNGITVYYIRNLATPTSVTFSYIAA